MSEETYNGVSLKKIPWGPIIDYKKCTSCRNCTDYCTLGVYKS